MKLLMIMSVDDLVYDFWKETLQMSFSNFFFFFWLFEDHMHSDIEFHCTVEKASLQLISSKPCDLHQNNLHG